MCKEVKESIDYLIKLGVIKKVKKRKKNKNKQSTAKLTPLNGFSTVPIQQANLQPYTDLRRFQDQTNNFNTRLLEGKQLLQNEREYNQKFRDGLAGAYAKVKQDFADLKSQVDSVPITHTGQMPSDFYDDFPQQYRGFSYTDDIDVPATSGVGFSQMNTEPDTSNDLDYIAAAGGGTKQRPDIQESFDIVKPRTRFALEDTGAFGNLPPSTSQNRSSIIPSFMLDASGSLRPQGQLFQQSIPSYMFDSLRSDTITPTQRFAIEDTKPSEIIQDYTEEPPATIELDKKATIIPKEEPAKKNKSILTRAGSAISSALGLSSKTQQGIVDESDEIVSQKTGGVSKTAGPDRSMTSFDENALIATIDPATRGRPTESQLARQRTQYLNLYQLLGGVDSELSTAQLKAYILTKLREEYKRRACNAINPNITNDTRIHILQTAIQNLPQKK